MTATHYSKVTTQTDVLYLAFELGETQWKLAFSIGLGQKPRLRSMPARDLPRLHEEIAKAKNRFGLPTDAPVHSCYEAGRDGFWLHRHLTAQGEKMGTFLATACHSSAYGYNFVSLVFTRKM